ncbi:hypothetical protein DL93DRAFT_365231 [Clavulina sp. PMI_390]|nr:hypothetical protein DL93DRAFT_365231 [Clavulina sp. PMI_390]
MMEYSKRIPFEILGYIFILALPGSTTANHSDEVDPRKAQALILSVCSTWRKIAESTPAFWNAIFLALPKFVDDISIPMLRRCCDHSGTLRISLYLVYNGEQSHPRCFEGLPETLAGIIGPILPRTVLLYVDGDVIQMGLAHLFPLSNISQLKYLTLYNILGHHSRGFNQSNLLHPKCNLESFQALAYS